MGGRDAVRKKVDRLKNAAKTSGGLEAQLRDIEKMPEDVAKGIYNNEGKNIWENCDWRQGRRDDSPWEFGNPTSASPPLILKALQAEIKSCNGGCIGKDQVYYRDTELTDPPDISYEEGTLDVYNVFFVVTPRQIYHLCNKATSCIKQ